ncbi:phosphate transport system permease protein [Blastococcus aggregatus]|uniref:Phosphate transport system permease protein n=1 Tax=Blastococcus aggregatus TaxID=38502 RepID=A0A285V892_9ACTN|nr:phosphate ABC transporter permease subunit PstC [Blastococcus aggregatus]SOC49266.1 phosphate transport system permease protein [Blastococcus aggregatus]
MTITADGGSPAVGTPRSKRGGGFDPTSLRRQSPRHGERVVMGVLIAAALLSVLVTVGIVLSLLLPAISFFREVSFGEFLFGTRWSPRFSGQESYGVLPLITGTAWTTLIALVIAIPFGLGAAIYLSEYAPSRVRKVLKPVLEVLAGIPSVVYGFFALTFVAPVILNDLLGLDVGTFSVLSAGLVLGIMIIPTVASLSEDAMSAVPDALRHGSMALGANKMRTTLRVVFPAAVSGIAASIVLALSRAVGETMIVALAAGTQARMVGGPTEVGQTMTGFIAQTATGESTPGTLSYNTLFAVGLLLFVITFVINMISIRLVRKFREAY